MVPPKHWSLVVLCTPILLVTAHLSSSSAVVQQASNANALISSALPPPRLNAAARSAGKLYLGTAMNNYQLNDTAYISILDDPATIGQFIPAKNNTEPEHGVFTWEQGDQIVALTRQGGKLMRGRVVSLLSLECHRFVLTRMAGHNCVWYNDIPDWVTNAAQIYSRDVINEPFDDSTWHEMIWYNALNTSYIPLALHAAHRADPHAKLPINEYNATGPGPKASALKALVRRLKTAGMPLHGIGVQVHEAVGEMPPLTDVKRNLEEFVALGVEVMITELDVRFSTLPPDEVGLKQQRSNFEMVMRACREVEGCVGCAGRVGRRCLA